MESYVNGPYLRRSAVEAAALEMIQIGLWETRDKRQKTPRESSETIHKGTRH
jgi:hypothetical protein